MSVSAKQQRAIEALLSSPSIRASAAKCGVGYSTLRRWLDEPDFSTELAFARRELTRSAMDTLRAAAVEAATVLVRNLSGSNQAAQIRAADLILAHLKGDDLEALEQRLAKLESLTQHDAAQPNRQQRYGR